jgi:hypothetical protein
MEFTKKICSNLSFNWDNDEGVYYNIYDLIITIIQIKFLKYIIWKYFMIK